jgi:VWFA-related protein
MRAAAPLPASACRIAILAALLAAAPTTGRAQEAERDAPLPSDLEERVEVNLLTVDFLATDRQGRPVTDLRPEEIRILDEGKEVSLAFLERIEEPPPWAGQVLPRASLDFRFGRGGSALDLPAGHRPRWVLFVLDRYNITPDTRMRAIHASQHFLGESWRPGDRAGLAVYDTAMRFVLDGLFTADPTLVSVALSDPDRYGPDPNFDRARALKELMIDMEDCVQAGVSRNCAMRLARRYVQDRFRASEDFFSNLELVARVLGAVPGRKYLVLFSHGFSIQPGLEAADAMQAVVGTRAAKGAHFELLEELGHALDAFIETAARHKVTVFVVDTRSKPSGTISAEHHRLTNEQGSPVDPFTAEYREAHATLTRMAEGTGGRHFVGSDALKELSEAFEAMGGLYTAGYYVDELKNSGWRRKVKVKVTRPGVRATHRGRYTVQRRLPPPVKAGLFPGEPRPAGDGRVALPITLVLDPESIPFHVEGGRAVSQLTVHVALHAEGGVPVAESFYFLGLEYPEGPFRSKQIRPPRYEGRLDAPAGRYLLKVRLLEPERGGVLDLETQIELPTLPPEGPAETTEASPPDAAGAGAL